MFIIQIRCINKSKVIIFIFFGITNSLDSGKKVIRSGAETLLESYYTMRLKLYKYISSSNDGLPCEVVPTTSTLQNFKMLHRGEIGFAFTQASFGLDSYNGKGYFINHEAFKDMCQLLRFRLHNKDFTVIVKDKDKILKFKDLDGREISNGS